jgi:hypothetical protein
MLLTHTQKNIPRKRFYRILFFSLIFFVALAIIIQNAYAVEATLSWNPNLKYNIGSHHNASSGIGKSVLNAGVRLCRKILSVGNFSKAKSSTLFFKNKQLRAYRYHHERYKTSKTITKWVLTLVFYASNHLKTLCLFIFGIISLFACIRILRIDIKKDSDFVDRGNMTTFPILSARHF